MEINDTILKQISDKLKISLNPLKIYLFGSYAWGTPNVNSDLDLMILLKESNEKPVYRGVKARSALREFKLPLDIIVWTENEFNRYKDVKSSLQYLIHQKGKLLYEQS